MGSVMPLITGFGDQKEGFHVNVHVNVNVPERESGGTLDLFIHVPTSSPDEHEIGKIASTRLVSKLS
jgi:hypothetical protein